MMFHLVADSIPWAKRLKRVYKAWTPVVLADFQAVPYLTCNPRR